MKPKVGDRLFDLNVGNAARRGCPQVLTPVEIIRVGRKYFTCAPIEGICRPETSYHVDSWREHTDYSASHQLFKTEQEYLDKRDAAQIAMFIRETFSGYGQTKIPVEKLREIKRILTKP